MKLQLITLLTVIGLSAFGQNNFKIDGKIELDEGNLLVLTQRVGGIDTLASTAVENGKFSLKGVVDEPVIALLKLEKYEGGFVMVLEPNNDYTAVLSEAGLGDIRGGELQGVFNSYRDAVLEANEKTRAIRQAIAEASEKKHFKTVNELSKQADEILKESRAQLDNILSDYSGSVLVAYIETGRLEQQANLDVLKAAYTNLADGAKQTPPGRILADRIASIEKTSVSAVAPNFTLPTPEGDEFSLYDLEGEVKIIDFWASWCGPCRMENPNMVKLYNDYKDKGLNILSVSLDERRTPWIKAIEKDVMPWMHVSSLNGWDCEVMKLYNVEAVPTILILDEDNRIIGKDIRAEELRAFVSRLLD